MYGFHGEFWQMAEANLFVHFFEFLFLCYLGVHGIPHAVPSR